MDGNTADPKEPVACKNAAGTCPMETCSLPSFYTMAWVTPLLSVGASRPLELSDVWDLPKKMHQRFAGPKFRAILDEQPAGKWRIYKALLKSFGFDYLMAVRGIPFLLLSQSLLPLLLKPLIAFIADEKKYLEDPFLGITSGWGLAGFLSAASLAAIFSQHCIFLYFIVFSCQVKVALQHALYQKCLQLSEASLHQSSLGQIMTLVSADMERIFMGSMGFIMLFNALTLMLISVFLLINEVGLLPAAMGFLVLAILVPLNAVAAQKGAAWKRKMLELTDSRVRFMTDVLQGIRIVKIQAWEEPVEQHIQTLRIKEMRANNISHQLRAVARNGSFIMPGLIPFFMFLTYTAAGHELTIEKVFAVLALMNMLRQPMKQVPNSMNQLSQLAVSMKRVEKFLSIPSRELSSASTARCDSGIAVELQDVCSTWVRPDEVEAMQALSRMAVKGKGKGKGKGIGADKDGGKDRGTADEKGQLQHDRKKGAGKVGPGGAALEKPKVAIGGVTLTIPQGQKVALVGRVGSGKSSLMSTILEELVVEAGSVVRATSLVPYCSQQPWIQSATLKENILFDLPEVPAMYQRVVAAAQLNPDFEALPDGDHTAIGENGINLSGGQKARAALARALYAALHNPSSLVLLDDPIAAVDAFVAHALFREAFMGLLCDHTVILSLNAHLDLLAFVDRVVVLEEGRIQVDGSLEDVVLSVPWVQDALGSCSTKKDTSQAEAPPAKKKGKEGTGSEDDAGSKANPAKSKAKALHQAEDRSKGCVSFRNYVDYARCAIADGEGSNAAGAGLVMAVLGLQSCSQVLRIGLDAFLASWAQNDLDFETAIMLYGSLMCAFAIVTVLSSAVFLFVAMRSCRAVHKVVLHKVLLAPINLFFDITPSGRILNRFSGDLDKLDERLPESLQMVLQNGMTIIGATIVCALSSPFVLIGIPVIFVLFLMIVRYFQLSARELKRLDMISRSPILQHFSETLRGLTTVRAFDAEERFSDKYARIVDTNAKVFFTEKMCSRWLALRVDSCSVTLQVLVVSIAVGFKGNSNPVVVGLALVWAFQLSAMLQITVRTCAEVENNFTGVERLLAYTKLPQEAAQVLEPGPAKQWPMGDIEFRGVSARYRPELPLVVKDVSLHILPGERVGICGRTGSGKSTMGLLLFRIVEVEQGQILIDGVDLQSVGLRDLRQRIAMIPQDPILFRMSVRKNIDTFDKFSNEAVWKCLEMVSMDSEVRKLSGDLDYLCAEGGANFSVGQRQLLCIARALLQDPGVVMMDEATANVDVATDEIIQRTIRSHFCTATVLTIAHRVSTIIDSTKIAMFEEGSLREFGTPRQLVQQQGMFNALLKEAKCDLPEATPEDAPIDLPGVVVNLQSARSCTPSCSPLLAILNRPR